MLRTVGIVIAALLAAQVLIVLTADLFGLEGAGPGVWALLAVVALFFYQRRELAALRRFVEGDLAALREQLGSLRVEREVRSATGTEPGRTEVPAGVPSQDTAVPTAAARVLADAAVTTVPVSAAAESGAAGERERPDLLPEPADDATPAWPLPAEDTREVHPWPARVTASAAASIRAWFGGGNTIVRVAVLVLFVGIAFLVRYAVEHEMLPIELRLAAVAAGGVVLLVLGWRLRERRRGYGLTLQGAGIGVIYMTLYAAMRLYGLLEPLPTLALLVGVAAGAALLALRQDALALAVAGFVGGFAAPLLASDGSGGPVLLFGYCAVLNLAIAAIASRKAWKLLNLIGFACTSLVAAAWGATAWQPELLARTEPFLVGHLALYLYITVQYARQLAPAAPAAHGAGGSAPPIPYVDGGLVFGVPMVAFGFQSVLVRDLPYALAASAAVMAVTYGLLGGWLRRRDGERLRLLTEGLLALGAVFLALVVPLALDARWTAAAWALQGAGMVWVAARQRRAWALHFGLVLQVLGAASFWSALPPADGLLFVANARVLGAVWLAAAALVSARALQRLLRSADPALPAGLEPALTRTLQWAALAVAVLHLLAGGALELRAAPWATPDAGQSLVLWTVLLAVALEAAHRRLDWGELALPARPLLALAALASLLDAGDAAMQSVGWARLWPGGLVEVAVVGVAAGWLLRRLDALPQGGDALRARRPSESLGWVWYAMLQGALVLHAVAEQLLAHPGGWVAGGLILLPTALAWLALARQARGAWPMDRHGTAWLSGLALPWMALLVVWSAAVNLMSDGAMRPLPYAPLMNPVDLAHVVMLLYALRLRRALQAAPGALPSLLLPVAQPRLVAATAAVAFWWLSSLLVRTLHHAAGTPLWADGALDSGLVQSGLSILWTVIALVTMFVATRRIEAAHARRVWIVGAALLGVVVVKLLLVDLSQIGALQRIVSFVGVGLLMLVVGYVAPLPPQRPQAGRA